MQIYFLGTCAGTEPMPNRHHTSIAIAVNHRLYWLDAGENCSYTAYLSGLDLPATEAIFISHTHMDHIGGLPNLLWTLRKLTSVDPKARRQLDNRTMDLYIPDLEIYQAVKTVLQGTEGGFKTIFSIEPKPCSEGVLYQNHGVKVKALPNNHLGTKKPFRSFSFRFEAEDKSVVYSGDVKDITDFAVLIDDCDLLLMETGHHRVEDVCQYLQTSGKNFGKLVFVHHGRAILADPEGELKKGQAILGDRILISEDGQCLNI